MAAGTSCPTKSSRIQRYSLPLSRHQLAHGSKEPWLPPPAFQNSLQPPTLSPSSLASSQRQTSVAQCWDEPLPEPKIMAGEFIQERRLTARRCGPVGRCCDVDLFRNRTRSAYVQPSAALSTQSFIAPLCHDTYTYGRIVEQ